MDTTTTPAIERASTLLAIDILSVGSVTARLECVVKVVDSFEPVDAQKVVAGALLALGVFVDGVEHAMPSFAEHRQLALDTLRQQIQ